MAAKAVVFDLDGTIINFNLDFKGARAEVVEFLTRQGFPSSQFSLNESVFEMLKKAEIIMKNNGKSSKDFEKLRECVLTILEKYEMESAQSASLVPGIVETLKALKKMKLKLALFTVNGKKTTNIVLNTFRLKPYFDVVVTRDSVPTVKPNPAHLETVLRKLRVKPTEIIVVGDSIWDMKSAQQQNSFAVGVTYGIATAQQLTQSGANTLITSPIDLIQLAQQRNSSE